MAEIAVNFTIPNPLPASLPVLPLKRGVLLPGSVAPFTVGRDASLKALEQVGPDGLVLVAVQREPTEEPSPAELMPVATLARVVRDLGQRGPLRAVLIAGLTRVALDDFVQISPSLEARYTLRNEAWPESGEAMRRSLVEAAGGLAKELTGSPFSALLEAVADPALLVDSIGALIESELVWKQELLQTTAPLVRAEKVLKQLALYRELLSAQRSIQDRVQNDLRGAERESILRRQLKAIQAELGEAGSEDQSLERLREKLDAVALSDEARSTVERELKRLERIPNGSPERSVALDWLEWIAALPFGKHSANGIDLSALEAELDRTHYGLKDVKRQVLEHLAVRKLGGQGRAEVLLLVGPPGVGKTSIGQAIADATGRKLVRVALGGVHDEAELRGHRRTYIGSRPGRLIEGLRRAETADPVVLLDEIDKLGRSHHGDPAAALLEILDPEQNHAFVDHYLEVPFDLSRVLFVATANDASAIPLALRDRLETLEIEGYTPHEKAVIARGHLLEKLARNTGLEPHDVVIEDDAIEAAISGHTREAGVRQLQRVLGRVFRRAAVQKAQGQLKQPLRVSAAELKSYLGRPRFLEERHERPTKPGIATGLAWTPLGGDVLYVEASTLPGSGKLVLTGQLGEVMKESAQAALTYVLAHARELGLRADALERRDLHLHVPAGATPKDGPSAGITMFAAVLSLLSGRPVAEDVAMTGEITLRGRVLPVGGIKSKVLAAHARGLTRVILPRANAGDLEDLPRSIRDEMRFELIDQLEDAPASLFAANLPSRVAA